MDFSNPGIIPLVIIPSFSYERALWQQGFLAIAGVDEAGCGAWAGPVYAAAVILIPGKHLPHVRDSKTLSASQRQALSNVIQKRCLSWSVASASVDEIASLNIREAAALATRRALEALSTPPDWILSDAFLIRGDVPCTPIIHGDGLSKTIAAASILAKVARDAFMSTLDKLYPGYSLANHKGYGTRAHQEALERLGPSPVHRVTYAPIRRLSDLPLDKGLSRHRRGGAGGISSRRTHRQTKTPEVNRRFLFFLRSGSAVP